MFIQVKDLILMSIENGLERNGGLNRCPMHCDYTALWQLLLHWYAENWESYHQKWKNKLLRNCENYLIWI